MGNSLICEYVGTDRANRVEPFNGAEVQITNPHLIISNDTWKKLCVFWRKKDAVAFCKRWGYVQRDITKVESRWQQGYAIGLGRGFYAPYEAESRMIAHRMGYLVKSLDTGAGADRPTDIKTIDGMYVPLDGDVI